MKGSHFKGTLGQAFLPILAVTNRFESFAHNCRNRWEGLAHIALKVSALHFCPVDFFNTYIFRIRMKNVKKWYISLLRYTNFNSKWFQEGSGLIDHIIHWTFLQAPDTTNLIFWQHKQNSHILWYLSFYLL